MTIAMGSLSPEVGADELTTARDCGQRLARWYTVAGRDYPWRHWRDLYRVLVTEMLLQRTTASVVAEFAPQFFDVFPSWASLATASLEQLEGRLAPIGLQRRRAKSLHGAALAVLSEPSTPLDALPGVGQYVERAVQVALNNAPLAMVDSNFTRMLRRIFPPPWRADYRFDPRLQSLALSVVEGAANAKIANWAVLDLGGTVCLPRRPRCDVCPLLDHCLQGGAFQTPTAGARSAR